MPDSKKEDPFIGLKFGKDKQIEVISRTEEKSGRNFKYLVHCSECAKDPELHGAANYVTARHSLKTGCLPCGCGRSPRWTQRQNTLRVERECSARGYTFIGWLTSKTSSTSRIRLRCNEDGYEWDTVPVALVKTGAGCAKCHATATSLRCKIGDTDYSYKFTASGMFLDGTKFSRNGKKRPSGEDEWEVICPVCSSDEYVREGLCTGVFPSVSSNLAVGSRPCRCSPRFQWTQQMQEYRIRQLADESTSFVGWVGEYKGSHTKLVMHCAEHQEYVTNANAFINSGTRCPSCSDTGFNPANEGSLYVLRIAGESTGFTGFGISCNINKRLATHKRELAKEGFKITDSAVFDFELGQKARDIENMLKKDFPRRRQVVPGFITEATQLELYEDVLDFIDVEISKEI